MSTSDASLAGKVAVITGAASGIGLGLAMKAARLGMTVVLADVEEGPLESATKAVHDLGVPVLAHRTDVSQRDGMLSLAEIVRDKFGSPWLLCNNAGVCRFNQAWNISATEWDWIIGVNLMGVVNGLLAFLPMMKAADAGHIVNTASSAGLFVMPGSAAYCASKHAVVGLSEALYRELQVVGSGVGTSVLCPKLVQSNILTADRNAPGSAADREAARTRDITFPDGLSVQDLEAKSPDEIAELVFSAVRENRFWILPHSDSMRESVLRRFEDALDEVNPRDETTDRVATVVSLHQSGLG